MEGIVEDLPECEVFTFLRDTKEAQLVVGTKVIKFDATPRLLGTILDQQLTFTPLTEEIIRRVRPSFRLMRAISHSEWGWPKKSLRSTYYSFVNC